MPEVILTEGEIKVTQYRKGYVGIMVKTGSDDKAKEVTDKLVAALGSGEMKLTFLTEKKK